MIFVRKEIILEKLELSIHCFHWKVSFVTVLYASHSQSNYTFAKSQMLIYLGKFKCEFLELVITRVEQRTDLIASVESTVGAFNIAESFKFDELYNHVSAHWPVVEVLDNQIRFEVRVEVQPNC